MTVVSDNTIQSSTPTTKSGSNQTSISSDGFNYIQGVEADRIEILKGTPGADIFLTSNNSGGDIIADFDASKDYLRFTDPSITKFVYSETYNSSTGLYLTAITGVGADGTILAGATVMAPLSEVRNRLQKSNGTPLVELAWVSDSTKEIDGNLRIIYAASPQIKGTSGNDTLTGGPSWDAIRGFEGDDTLIGNGFPDGLLGGSGNDTLDGGTGNDAYAGGTGKDTFLIGMNPGEDNIIDFSKSEGDIIKITDTRVTKVTVDETKTTSGQFVSVVSGLDDKGTVLTKTFVFASKDSLMGGIQDSDGEILFGGTTAATDGFNLVKGIDDDRVEILKGTDGADLFLRSSSKTGAIGDKLAPDIVVDFDPNKDFLRFTDPTITQIGFSEVYQPSAGRYVTNIVGYDASGQALALFTVMAPRNEVEGRIQNSAGASITKVLYPSNITETDGDTSTIYNGDPNLQGTPGNDPLTGTPSSDVLRGKAGNDTLRGGGGSDGLLGGAGDDTLDGGSAHDGYVGYTGKDTFLIGANASEDFIYDFNKSEGDIIKITDTRVTKVTVDETKTASGQFVTVVSGLDDKGTVLTKTFVNSSKDSLGGGIQDSDGEIIFAGSTTPKTGTIPGATDGSDFLSGTPGKDIIDGKGGNDVIFGDSGADTFIQTKGSGTDYLLDFKKSEGDVLEYAADSGVTSVKVSDTVQLGLPMRQVDGLDKDGKVVVTTYTLASTADLQGQIKDSAGTVLFGGSTTPETGTISGTDIAETVDGTENKDTIDGKGGNDLIYGEGGADTFLEGKTSGVDTIYKFSKTEGDVIKYTDKDIVGAAVSEVTQPDGQKFSKVDGLDAAGKILVSTLVEAPVDDVKSQIRNSDNGIINVGGTTPPTATISGTGGSDLLIGTPQNDVFDGKGGADIIFGGKGKDVFLEGKDSASGKDYILDFRKADGDVLQLTDSTVKTVKVSDVVQLGLAMRQIDALDKDGKVVTTTYTLANKSELSGQIQDSKGTSLFDVYTTNLKDVDPNANVTLTFTVSGDQFNGSPNGVITLGDKTLTTFTATADGRARKTQEISVKVKAGDLLGQSQELRVTFTNDAASGRATPNLDDYLTDRNLRVHDLKITLPDNTVLDYDLNKAVLNQIAQGSLRSSAATDASNGPRGNILYENGSNIAINTTSLTTENLSTPSQTSNALTGSSAAETFAVSSTDALTVIKDFDKAADKLKVSGITANDVKTATAAIALNGALIDFGSTSVFLSGSFSQTEADSIAKATLVG
jgi:Ca2+-binding RTX toxin-like protein